MARLLGFEHRHRPELWVFIDKDGIVKAGQWVNDPETGWGWIEIPLEEDDEQPNRTTDG
jgi:hypothetical protein